MGRFQFLFYSLLSLGVAVAEDIQYCDKAPYYPSQYTCYDGMLCRILSGPTKRCGNACYSPLMYTCNNGKLNTLPTTDSESAYAIHASFPGAPFDGQVIDACDRHFFIGRGPCTYCPEAASSLCPTLPNITALVSDRGMSTAVPGGQRFYIEQDGALSFTQAHSGASPAGSVFGVSAVENGGFVYPTGDGWYVCPTGPKGQYQIFQRLEGNVLDAACIKTDIATKVLGNGPFTWQYV